MNWPFGDLQPGSYGLIVADPPWSFRHFSAKGQKKGAQAHYACMTLEEIKALPVRSLAAPDALCILWATNPMLPHAIETLDAWGFNFKTAGHWVKRTKNGHLAFGTGYVVRSAGEPFLIGTIGKPTTSRSCRSVIEGLAREHSRKPEEGFEWAQRLMPQARRVELFSRQARAGWDSWGAEVDKFTEEAA